MNYYQEITLISSVDTPLYQLWSKLYKQLHIALADINNQHGIDTIGVSFPNYRYEEKGGSTFTTLGDKLRIFALSSEDLELLNMQKWLERLLDYVHIKRISEVADVREYLVVRRYHYKSINKQAERFAEFKGISFDDALTHCKEHKITSKKYPFITLASEKNSCDYRINILQETVSSQMVGTFNTYGINNMSAEGATVPHW